MTTVRRVCRTLKLGRYELKKPGAITPRSSQIPYGWRRDGGGLCHHPEEWSLVLEMKWLRERGLSLHKIAAKLNDDGVPTKNKRRWHAKSVSQILEFNAPILKTNKPIRR